MAPKGRAKTTAAAAAAAIAMGSDANAVKAESGAAVANVAAPAAALDEATLLIHAEAQAAKNTIVKFYGEDCLTMDPPKVGEGGYLAPIDGKIVMTNLSGTVVGGINSLWLNPTFSLTPGVSVKRSKIEKLIRTYFPQGTPEMFSHVFELKVPDGKIFDKLALTRLSPEEPHQALFIHVARRLRLPCDVEESTKWLRVLTSCQARFRCASRRIHNNITKQTCTNPLCLYPDQH